jgi:hypothetical protein
MNTIASAFVILQFVWKILLFRHGSIAPKILTWWWGRNILPQH